MIITGANCFVLLRNKKLLKQNYAYVFIAFTAIGNLLQLSAHFISGFYIIFSISPPLHFVMLQGSILNFGFDVTCILTLALSFNRLFLFFNFHGVLYIILKKLTITIIAMLCLVAIFYLIIPNFDFFKIVFNVKNGVWEYYTVKENFNRFNFLEGRLMVSVNLASVLILVLIACKIVYQKLTTESYNNSKKIKFYDISLFLQALFNFLCIGFVQVFWQFGDVWFPNSTYLYTYLNYLWLNVAGRDSVFNLLLLREVRLPILVILKYYKTSAKVVQPQTTTRNMKNNVIS
uniref:7TM_GPCR_Srx domain-containing protein n=1 Tax=Strongyloides papillosus TaxID=174720 RepID=A0A0N5BVG6_STREA